MTRNLLAEETSPYLLQHRDNPVDWQPWDRLAIDSARLSGKPILLSIGYSACHWCHVMAHESFENPDIAALMNELYINIKVDREERPDLDSIYQRALSLLGQQGGWPLTMFLTPDGEPFWGGTYFPPEQRYGRPGFIDVLRMVDDAYRGAPDKVKQNNEALTSALNTMARPAAGGEISPDLLDRAARRLLEEVDPVHGGIGGAPKFPQTMALELLWRAYGKSGDVALRDAVVLSVDRMCQGGIYDHLGGGFSRYSVDEIWLAPHFEKMLYDNAQLLELLCSLWRETGAALFKQRAAEVVRWAMTEMIAPDGGFAAAYDADSEGVEGKYYVWREAEIDQLLGDDAARFKAAYDVSARGNWEGNTILNRTHIAATDADNPGPVDDDVALSPLRDILLGVRAGRVPPLHDDKVLADWNGLMIAAMAQAGATFDQPGWIDAAIQAFDFVAARMTVEGRLR
ncbi:MAG: thioredoxin domain-containing protein, partial [Alphaproteobacteria bacterium]